MATWLVVLLAGASAVLVCFGVLVVLSSIGVAFRLSSGPVVVGARVVMVLMVVAAWVCLAAGTWGSVDAAVSTLR